MGAQHAGIVRMFVASDSVRLARQTKGFQNDEDVDQCRFFTGDESLGRAWGVLRVCWLAELSKDWLAR